MAVRAGFICDCDGAGDPLCGCDCANCEPTGGTYVKNAPCCLDIAIGGFAAASPVDCAECTAFNRTYHAAYQGGGEWFAPAGCQCCTENPGVTATLVLESGDYILRVTFGDDVWEINLGTSRPSCCAWSGLSLTKTASGSYCSSTSATCSVSVGTCTSTATRLCNSTTTLFQTVGCRQPDEITVDCSEIIWSNGTCSSGCDSLATAYVLTGPYCYTYCTYATSQPVCSGVIFAIDLYLQCDYATGKLRITATVGTVPLLKLTYRRLFDIIDEAGNCLTLADILATNPELDFVEVNGTAGSCNLISYPSTLPISL
jgi:hypothetical protein